MSDFAFVKKLKESQRSVPVEDQVRLYFDLLGEIKEAKRNRDMDKVFMFSQMSLPFLGALINDTKQYSGKFDIVEIPALDEGFIIAIVKGLRGQTLNFKEVVAYYKELEPWRRKFEEMEKLSEIVGYIKKNSGLLQKDLKTIFKLDANLLGQCSIYLENCGLIKRERTGNTFRLFWR